jgi:DNA-binding HxlR family transcriptional regulator
MKNQCCPVLKTLKVMGGKWKPVILYYLSQNKKLRYNELRRQIPGVTQRMLTLQLRELEQDGIIDRKIFPVVPPHVEYSLTSRGKSLLTVIEAMHKWGEKFERETAKKGNT